MIYVDQLAIYRTGWWCHMMTDGPVEEIHEFAKLIGVPRSYYRNPKPGDRPHYDLRANYRTAAVVHGAQVCSSKYLVDLMRSRRTSLTKPAKVV